MFLPVNMLSDVPQSVKSGSISLLYGIIAAVSVLLVLVYRFSSIRKEKKLLLLCICVALANLGYFLLSVSDTLTGAMMANRLSYLGNAFSVLLMLVIIVDACGFRAPKWVTAIMIGISTLAFLLAACGDWNGLYYSQVSLKTVNGATRLVKVYGPLHFLYGIYLYSSVLAMLCIILYAIFRRKITTAKQAMLLIAAVIGNVGVWFVGQFVDVEFEFLSVSMMLTEMILLLLYEMLHDYQAALEQQAPAVPPAELPRDLEALFAEFQEKTATLSSAEQRILEYYIEGYEISEIPELAFISIHTVKKHNRSIYQKLGVASRDDLMLFIELFRRSGRLDALTRQN